MYAQGAVSEAGAPVTAVRSVCVHPIWHLDPLESFRSLLAVLQAAIDVGRLERVPVRGCEADGLAGRDPMSPDGTACELLRAVLPELEVELLLFLPAGDLDGLELAVRLHSQ